MAVLQRKHGRPSTTWRYDNAEGQPVGLVIRWDKPTGKDVRPVSRTSDGRWIIGAMPEPRPLYGLLLDVTGCAGVWGGEERLARAALDGLARLGFEARAAIAPTFGAAWGLARFGMGSRCGGDSWHIVDSAAVRAAMSPLPISALRVGADVVASLAAVGVERVEHLLDLPRSTLPARFGSALLLRLDQFPLLVGELVTAWWWHP